MVKYELNDSRVLIVPGYTDKELLLQSGGKKKKNRKTSRTTASKKSKNTKKKTTKTKGKTKTKTTKKIIKKTKVKKVTKAIKRKAASKNKKTKRSTKKSAKKSNKKTTKKSNKKTTKSTTVAEPTSFLFEARNIQVQPHRPSYEEFRSSDGLFMIEKNCDEFTQIQMDILVHQNLSDSKGKLVVDKQTKEIRLRVTDNSIPKDNDKDNELLVGRYVRPEEFTEKYIQIRSNFLKDLLGRPLTLVSPLFEAVPVAYITDYDYNIPEGEEEASYSVTFQEVATTGF